MRNSNTPTNPNCFARLFYASKQIEVACKRKDELGPKRCEETKAQYERMQIECGFKPVIPLSIKKII